MKYQSFWQNTMISYRKKYSLAAGTKPDVSSCNEWYDDKVSSKSYEFQQGDFPLLLNRRMPSVYHEHCGKPGPKSNDYLPPPEASIFQVAKRTEFPFIGPTEAAYPISAIVANRSKSEPKSRIN